MCLRYDALKSLVENRKPKYERVHENMSVNYSSIWTRIKYFFLTQGDEILNFVQNWNTTFRDHHPDIVFIGFAHWPIDRATGDPASDKSVDSYGNWVRKISLELERYKIKSDFIWVVATPLNDAVFRRRNATGFGKRWSGVMDKFHNKYPNNRNNATIVDLYNNKALDVLQHTSVWQVFEAVERYYLYKSGDGIHVHNLVLHNVRQIIANYICNRFINVNNDACCKKSYSV